MIEKPDITCLVVSDTYPNSTFLGALNEEMKTVMLRNGQDPRVILRSRIIHSVLLYINEHTKGIWERVELIRKFFSSIPIIGVVEPSVGIDVIRQCGAKGVDKVILTSNLTTLIEAVHYLNTENKIYVSLKDLGINKELYEGNVLDALSKIETNYIKLMGTREIADYLDIHESTLSREFKNNNLINPKRLLLYLKVNHAIRLMRNEGLSLKEITNLSGFTDAKRFNECFKKVTGFAPSLYREEKVFNLETE